MWGRKETSVQIGKQWLSYSWCSYD